jgi:predicted membrane channel-forming protein YqfA (hemolysin III family)
MKKKLTKNGNGDFSLAIAETNNSMFLSKAKYDLAIVSLLAAIILPIIFIFIESYKFIGFLLTLAIIGTIIACVIRLLLARYYKKYKL